MRVGASGRGRKTGRTRLHHSRCQGHDKAVRNAAIMGPHRLLYLAFCQVYLTSTTHQSRISSEAWNYHERTPARKSFEGGSRGAWVIARTTRDPRRRDPADDQLRRDGAVLSFHPAGV